MMMKNSSTHQSRSNTNLSTNPHENAKTTNQFTNHTNYATQKLQNSKQEQNRHQQNSKQENAQQYESNQNFTNSQQNSSIPSSSTTPQANLNFKQSTLQYNPSTQNLMINLANQTLGHMQQNGSHSVTNAQHHQQQQINMMQVVGSSLTPHANSSCAQLGNGSSTVSAGNQNSNQKSKSSLGGGYSSLSNFSKKQVKPSMSTYNSIKNLHNEVKNLFENTNPNTQHHQQQQQNIQNIHHQQQQNSNQNSHYHNSQSNIKNQNAVSRTTNHQYSHSSLSHTSNSQNFMLSSELQQPNQPQYQNQNQHVIISDQSQMNQIMNPSSLNHFNQTNPPKSKQSNTFIHFGKKNSLQRQNSDSMNNNQQINNQYQQLQQQQISDQEYLQYIQNFTLQASDGSNQYQMNEVLQSRLLDSSQVLIQQQIRAQTSSPPVNQLQMSSIGHDSSSLRLQTGTFSPNPSNNLGSQIIQNQPHGNQLTNQVAANINIHPVTTKNQNKKVSYFGTKAPTFKVQNSITKSQSNKNLINEKFQSQGLQLAQGNNPHHHHLAPQMSVTNLMLARAGGQIVTGSTPLSNPQQHQNLLQQQFESSNKSQQIKMIDLINSQAKKPYESKGKKSIMNESSQLIGVQVETVPSAIMNKDGQLVQYVQSRTAMENYRQSTDLNFYQKHSQSLANSNDNLSRQQEIIEGTFSSMKDSLQYVVSDEAALAQQQEVHDLQSSIEKESILKRKKFSTDLQGKLQITPLSKGQNQSQNRQTNNFNQTIVQPNTANNLFSPGDNPQSSILGNGVGGTSLKNKTQKLNKMLKTLISDSNPTYSQITTVCSPKPQANGLSQINLNNNPNSQSNITAGNPQYQNSSMQPNTLNNYNSKNSLKVNHPNQMGGNQNLAQTQKKEGSQSKTAIQNFKKQSKGMKNGKQINIQSTVKPTNQHKVQKNATTNHKDTQANRRTPLDNYNNQSQPQIQIQNNLLQSQINQQPQHQPIQINLYSSESQVQLHHSPQNVIGDQLQLLIQMDSMRKEIEELKGLKLQLQNKDKEIQHLKKKISTISHEKNRLRYQVSASRAGGIGGQIDQSSGNVTSGGDINSTSKKVDRSAISSGGASRSYAKPFQQLVSHIKSKAIKNKQGLELPDLLSPQITSQTKELMSLPIINENLIKSLNQQTLSTRNRKPHQSNNGVTSNHRLLNGNQSHVQSQPLLLSPTQVLNGGTLIGSPSALNGLNNFSGTQKISMQHFNQLFNQNEDAVIRMSSPNMTTEDQSPPLKLKRVVSQRSIDSVSNYSSSQQKRENLRYKRSHDEWAQNHLEQNETSTFNQSQNQNNVQLNNDISDPDPSSNQEILLTQTHLTSTQDFPIQNIDIRVKNIKQLSPSQRLLQQKPPQVPGSRESLETQKNFTTQNELLQLKNKMFSFVKNYTQYVRYLENKIRKLENEGKSTIETKNTLSPLEKEDYSNYHSQPIQSQPLAQHQ